MILVCFWPNPVNSPVMGAASQPLLVLGGDGRASRMLVVVSAGPAALKVLALPGARHPLCPKRVATAQPPSTSGLFERRRRRRRWLLRRLLLQLTSV